MLNTLVDRLDLKPYEIAGFDVTSVRQKTGETFSKVADLYFLAKVIQDTHTAALNYAIKQKCLKYKTKEADEMIGVLLVISVALLVL